MGVGKSNRSSDCKWRNLRERWRGDKSNWEEWRVADCERLKVYIFPFIQTNRPVLSKFHFLHMSSHRTHFPFSSFPQKPQHNRDNLKRYSPSAHLLSLHVRNKMIKIRARSLTMLLNFKTDHFDFTNKLWMLWIKLKHGHFFFIILN